MKRTYSPEVLAYLSQFDERLLATSEGRRVLTRLNPRLFVLLYLIEHVTDSTGHVSFSEVHLDWFDQFLGFVKTQTEPRKWRKAFIAPRAMGKSTVWFMFLPMWAGAHGFSKYMLAFSDSSAQATQHLASFKAELAKNELLKRDYPEFVQAARRPGGQTEADSQTMYKSRSGFIFSGKGIESGSLGAKSGALRPDVLLFDDSEGAAGVYTLYQAESRLQTITDSLLPINELARVIIVGTTTIAGGIAHQLVQSVVSKDPPAQWISDEKFTAHYYPAIMQNPDGTRRSVYPEKWSLEFLESIEHTRSYRLNFLNLPSADQSDYWSDEDFVYGAVEACTRTMISIDPAVSTKRTSDETGIAVVAYSPSARKALVRHSEGVKLGPAELRLRVLALLEQYPEVGLLYIESNQGGNAWDAVFHNMPVKIKYVTSSVKKEVRASNALNHYQRGRVLHEKRMPELEQQMVAFPRAAHDDRVDAVCQAVTYFLAPVAPPKKAGATTMSYI